jgi:hypothetical protein
MLFKRISRTDPERIFMVCSNGYATASLIDGQAVMWDMGDADGISVTMPSVAFKRMGAFAGIVAQTIAAGEYGLLQIYGYHSSIVVDSSATEDIFTGAPLFSSVAAFHLEGPYEASGTTDELYVEHRVVGCALEATTSAGTTARIKGIIYAM